MLASERVSPPSWVVTHRQSTKHPPAIEILTQVYFVFSTNYAIDPYAAWASVHQSGSHFMSVIGGW